jgi:glycosyltransferase involved in cell wall biosynthesis
MRIAFISTMHGATWGGSEELWSQAAHMLKGDGHDVFASVAYWLRQSDRVNGLVHDGIQVETHSPHQVGRVNRLKNKLLYGGPRVYDRLRQFNPDLAVISQGHNAGGFEWAKILKKMSIPYVLIAHCNSDQWWFGDQLGDAIESYTAAQKVFCVSHANLDLLRLQLGEPLSTAEVVWNPYNVSKQPAPAWPDESAGWRIAVVGRLQPPAKGQDLLLQALARPEWRGRSVELNLYGVGPDESALRRMAKNLQLENVNFHGHVSDIRSVWARNHILALPSRYEGLPLTLVEAMWCERPAVVTDVGGNAELCVDGETGFVASAATLSSFSSTLQRAWELRKDWPRIGKAGRARVEKLIPADPVAQFCEQLKACASGSLVRG